jgi:hypothetical protein
MPVATDVAVTNFSTSLDTFLDTLSAVDSARQWPNAPFDLPNVDGLSGSATVWAAVSFQMGDRVVLEFGTNPTFRTAAVVTVQLFTPAFTGEGNIRAVAELLRANYEGKSISSGSIRIMNPRVITVGERSGWWQVNVELPFRFDSLKG